MSFYNLKKVSLTTFLLPALLNMTILSSSLLLSADEVSNDKTTLEQTPESSDEQDKTYLLIYKFQPNQILKYDINHSTSVDTAKGEFNEINTNESITQMHYRVVTVDSSQQAILEPVLDHVKMSATFAETKSISYDSSKDETTPPQFSGVDESIGKPLSRYKFSNNGTLLEILDLRKAGQGDPNLTNASNQARELLGNQNFLVVFPDHPVKVGDKWNEPYESILKISESLVKQVKFIRKYQLESVENNQAVLSLKTILISQVEDPKLRLQLIQKAHTGKIVFDYQTGIIISRELDIDQTEFGVFGDNSKIRVSSKRIEKQIQ